MDKKTKVIATSDSPYDEFKKGDKGYIDGYVQGSDDRPYAVFVRYSDGSISMGSVHQFKAVNPKGDKT